MTDIDDHCRAAKAHIEKGDKAKDKAEQHYISAGEHIKAIKEATPDQASFLEIVKLRIGVAKSRTYELLQIADGRKTVEEVNERRADSMRRSREMATCPPRGGQTEDDDIPPFLDRTGVGTGSRDVATIEDEPGDDDQTIWRRGLVFRAQAAVAGAAFEDWSRFHIDQQVVDAARAAADAWSELARYLEEVSNGKDSAAA